MVADASIERLNTLRTAGLSLQKITSLAGVGHQTLWQLLSGRRKRVHVGTADQILSIPIPTQPIPGGARQVPALGTRRRLQALMAYGYPQTLLAKYLGFNRRSINRFLIDEYCSAESAARVYETFKHLEMIPGPSNSARKRALDKGWLPPLYWDNETINDPSMLPSDSGSGILGLNEFLDIVDDHRSVGHTDIQIAKAIGVTVDSLHARMRRNGISHGGIAHE